MIFEGEICIFLLHPPKQINKYANFFILWLLCTQFFLHSFTVVFSFRYDNLRETKMGIKKKYFFGVKLKQDVSHCDVAWLELNFFHIERISKNVLDFLWPLEYPALCFILRTKNQTVGNKNGLVFREKKTLFSWGGDKNSIFISLRNLTESNWTLTFTKWNHIWNMSLSLPAHFRIAPKNC